MQISRQENRAFPSLLGIVMLETQFPRPLGDVGHPDTFGVPTRRLVVAQAAPTRVVQSAQALLASGLAPHFVAAAQALEHDGCEVITTSCGFLVLLQAQMQAALKARMVSSSLLALPRLLSRHRQVGVLTMSAQHLGAAHLLAAGVPRERLGDVIVAGMPPECEFAQAILGNRNTMNFALAKHNVVQAASSLKATAPHLTELVLECTNMPPYASAIAAATGFAVTSLQDCIFNDLYSRC
jgi:hypothetical protein